MSYFNGAYDSVEEEDNSLMHYGVKGMKWGRRRASKYQNDKAMRKYSDSATGNARETKALQRNKTFHAKSKDRVARSGGSIGLANTKVVGRTLAVGLLSSAVGSAAMSRVNSSSGRAAVGVGMAAVKAINLSMAATHIIGNNLTRKPPAKSQRKPSAAGKALDKSAFGQMAKKNVDRYNNKKGYNS